MINDILNGLGVTEVLKPEITAFSKRSGSSTTSRSTATDGGEVYTLPDGKQYTLTKAQYADFNKVYNEAYGYAYSKNINPPQVKDVLKYGQIVADWYKNGRVFTEAKYLDLQEEVAEERAEANAAIAYQTKVINTPYISADERAEDIRKAVENAKDAIGERAYKEAILDGKSVYDATTAKQQAEDQYWLENYEYVRQAEMDAVNGKIGSNGSSLPFPEWIIEMQKNESAQATPRGVVMHTVQPPEEKQGSGILVPALIFAVGAIAAIVLVKSKPKRR